MNHFVIVSIMFVVGGMIALQGTVNSQLGKHLEHPLHSAMFSFGSGFIILLIAPLFFKCGYPSLEKIFSAPKIYLIGGLLGTVFVSSCIIFIPKIGIANVLLAALCGQIIFSLIFDAFGVLGLNKYPIDFKRAAGAFLVLIGVILLNLQKK